MRGDVIARALPHALARMFTLATCLVVGAQAHAETAASGDTRMLCEAAADGSWDCSRAQGEPERVRRGAPIPDATAPTATLPADTPVLHTPIPVPPPRESARGDAVVPAYTVPERPPADAIALPEPTRRQRVRILAQPRTAWAIQLIATTSRESLERVAERYDLFDRPAVRLASGNSVRYALVWDVYPTRAQAEAALKTLPPALREMKPWVRAVGPLQDAMNEATRVSPPAERGRETRDGG